MKCPLLATAEIWLKPKGPIKYSDCLKEECAWWDEQNGQCVIKGIMIELRCAVDILEEVRDKMPRVGQFKK